MNSKEITRSELQNLILLGMIIALKIILGQISFGPAFVKIGLGFIGSVLLGTLFGPVWGFIGGGLSDLIASAIFGNQGGFFVGFTLTAALGPLIYAFFFYQKPVKIWRIIAATLSVTLLIDMGLNTWWIHLLYGVNFKLALMERLPKELIAPWLQMIVIYFVLQALARVKIKK